MGTKAMARDGDITGSGFRGLHLVEEAPTGLDGRRVLIADDGPDLRFRLGRLLQEAGAEVSFASDGRQAQNKLAGVLEACRPYALVLLTTRFDADQGLSLARRLRERGYRGPILAISDRDGFDSREACLDAGCDEVISRGELEAMSRDELLARLDGLASSAAHVGSRPPASLVPSAPDGQSPAVTSDLAAYPTMRPMLEKFVVDLSQRLRSIEAAARAGDLEAMGDLVARLKRSAGSHGFVPISREAGHVEQTLRQLDRNEADLDRLVGELKDLCQRATPWPSVPVDPDDDPLPPTA